MLQKLVDFSRESDSERSLKIGLHLPKFWSKVTCIVFFDSHCRSQKYCLEDKQ